jgi:hypothetical protein
MIDGTTISHENFTYFSHLEVSLKSSYVIDYEANLTKSAIDSLTKLNEHFFDSKTIYYFLMVAYQFTPEEECCSS